MSGAQEIDRTELDFIPSGQGGYANHFPVIHASTHKETPFGAWCRCADCGLVALETSSHPFHETYDALLMCGDCDLIDKTGDSNAKIELVRKRLREILADEKAYQKANPDGYACCSEDMHREVDRLRTNALRAVPEVADITELADEIEETVNGFWYA